MEKNIIIVLVFFIINIYSIISEEGEISIYSNILENLSTKINQIIVDLSDEKSLENCLKIMNDSFQGEYKNSYLTKLFYDSSPTFEDIKNYYNCYDNLYTDKDKHILENLTFVIIKYTDKEQENHSEYENSFHSFSKVIGACIPKGCEDSEYSKMIGLINDDYHLLDGTVNGVINLKPSKNYTLVEKISQLLIPFLMFIFIILVIEIKHISGLLWSLFGYFFNIFQRNKYGEENIKKILKKIKLIK